LRIKLESVSAE